MDACVRRLRTASALKIFHPELSDILPKFLGQCEIITLAWDLA